MRKIAIYGGSFDPPHLGHLEIIKSVLKNLEPDLFFIVPTFLNPFKDSYYFSPTLHLKWLKILTNSLNQNAIKIIDYEIKQAQKTPTIKTLEFLKKTYNLTKNDKIYLIVGADNVESLPKWAEFERLKNSVEFVIIARNGYKIPPYFKKLPFSEILISSTQLRKMLKMGDFKGLKKWIPPLIFNDLKEEFCKIEKK
ncbi:MAG: nicotinate (nicotinamide) nucleotide adenylyltransferase [Helicobacter sp.]|nr:nicotinate (nicotinamide) nucleotide adenylyltransferase [Helicobacteraceae bacterium]MDY3112868.1 nicotinate (nicotinamide) nucleotide adenylyltransferase [Helicobacter sp.]